MGGAPAKFLQIVQGVALRAACNESCLIIGTRIGEDLQNLGDVIEVELRRRKRARDGVWYRFYRHANRLLFSCANLLASTWPFAVNGRPLGRRLHHPDAWR